MTALPDRQGWEAYFEATIASRNQQSALTTTACGAANVGIEERTILTFITSGSHSTELIDPDNALLYAKLDTADLGNVSIAAHYNCVLVITSCVLVGGVATPVTTNEPQVLGTLSTGSYTITLTGASSNNNPYTVAPWWTGSGIPIMWCVELDLGWSLVGVGSVAVFDLAHCQALSGVNNPVVSVDFS